MSVVNRGWTTKSVPLDEQWGLNYSMTNGKAVYYKDDGEPCQLCQEQTGFCHIHADAAESDDSGFVPEDNPNHCTECESPIRVHSAALIGQQFNDARVNVNLVLQCECTESEIPNGVNTVARSSLPDCWTGR